MRIQSKYQIEQATTSDHTRFILTNVFVHESKAIATDGRILASVPVEHEESEAGKMIRAQDFKTIRKHQKNAAKVAGEHIIEMNGAIKAEGDNGAKIEFSAPEGNFPNYKGVIPQGEPKFKIGLDVQLLVRLVKAIGADGNEKGKSFVELEFFVENEAFIVRNHKDKAAYGVQMPIKIL